MKQRFQQSLLLMLLALLAVPLGAWADREVNQLQLGKQVIDVASDEVITFYDPWGTANIVDNNSYNAQSLTVFKPVEAGMSVQITFETIDLNQWSNSYFLYLNLYDGIADANDAFSWPTSTSNVTSSSNLDAMSGEVIAKGINNANKPSLPAVYTSGTSDGALSVGFMHRNSNTCEGWVAKVKVVKLEKMTVTGAGSTYDGVVASPSSKQNVTLANAYVTAEGVMNPDNITGIYFTLTKNEGVVDPTALKLYKGDTQVESTVETDGTGYKFVLNEAPVSGTTTFAVRGDILGTAAIGAKVQLNITKVTTVANPSGVAPFSAATAVEVETPALVLMTSTAQTVTVGETPLQFYDEGGKDGSIKGTTSGQVTFLAGVEGQKVMIDFSKIALNNGSIYYQALKVYNGTEVSAANLLADLRNGQTVRVRSTAANGALTVVLEAASQNYDYDGFEALVSLFTPQPMDFDAVTAAVASEETVVAGDADQPMLTVNVKAKETEPAMQVTKMAFNTNGTFALIDKAALFFGTTKVGEANVTADDFEIAVDQQALVEGDNFFTLAYTVSDEAQNDQTVGAKLTSVTALVNNAAKTQNAEADAAVATRTVYNLVLSHADQGTVSKTVNGSMAFSTKTASSYSSYCEAGTDDRVNVFVPKHEGHVMQIDFTEFDVQYSSSYYGNKSKFRIYAGQGTDGELLWELNSDDQSATGPGKLIRSTAADGALTVVFNPNSTYSYYYKGFKANVSEYLPKNMEIATIEATHPTTADASAGGKQQQLLDIDVQTEGNLEPIVLSAMTFNMKGTQKSLERIYLYHGETLLCATDVDATLELCLDFSNDVTLLEGNNLFSLKADVLADAAENQPIDARVVSVNVGEDILSVTGNTDPEGQRIVKNIVCMQQGDNGEMQLALGKKMMIYDDGGAEGDGTSGVEGTLVLSPTGDADCIKLTDMGISFAYTAHLYIYEGGEADEDKLIVDLSGSSAKFQPIISNADLDGGKLTIRYVGIGSYPRPNFAIEAEGYKKSDVAITAISAEDISVGEVLKGQTDVKMLRIAVEAKGELAPATITAFNITTGGEAMTAQHIYQTGTTTTFSANDEFGGEYAITNSGTYYFWLCYDMNTEAEVGQSATATLASVVVNGETISANESATATVDIASGKSGTYTVGQGGDYATIQQAIDDFGTLGMEGPVVLKIKAGEYNEKVRIPYIKGMGAVNTLTMESESGQRDVKIYHDQYTISGYSDDQHKKDYGVITLYEASYVTLRNLEVTTTDKAYKAVVMVKDQSRYVTIDNCYLHAPACTASSGEDVCLVGHTIIDEENKNNDYLTVSNCLLEGGKMGVSMGGTNYVLLPKEVGGVIEGNTFKNNAQKAIYVMDELGVKIRNNTIIIDADAPTKISVGLLDMQLRDEYSEATEITGNIFNVAPSTYCAVMNLRQLEGTTEAPVLIANNVINLASLNASYAAFKFNGSKAKNVNVAHNTIRMTGTNGGAAFWAASKLDAGYGNISVVNNIIQNETNGYAVNLYNDANLATDMFNFQNNVMYTAGATFFRAASSTTGDFAAFVEKTGATGCLNQQVQFASDDILEPENTLDGQLLTALPLSYVTTDVTGRERPAEGRTIGAYEYDDSPRVAPTMAEGYPQLKNIAETTATLLVKADVAGTAFVLVQQQGQPTPEAAQVLQSSQKTVFAANTEASISLSGLQGETDYVAYVVLQSSHGQATNVISTPFATAEVHVDPATMDIWMNNDHAHQTTIDEEDAATIFVMGIEGGKAPFTLTVATAYGEVIETEEISADDADDYMGMFDVEPTQSTDYVLTLVDAQQNITCDTLRVIVTGAAQMASFDDLWYDSDEDGQYDYMFGPFWMNTVTESWGQLNYSGTFLSGSYAFSNNCMPSYGSFDGFAYSRSTSTTFSPATFASDQFNAVTGGGYKGSETFAIGYVGYSNMPTVTVLNSESGDRIRGFYVTNSAYALDAILNGDGQQNVVDANGQACAPTEGFHEGDYLLLTATGYDANGQQTGTASFYLADYRSADAAQRYYVNDWQWFDLSPLGVVKTIEFSMSATRHNQWGTTTPLYFCLDNFNDPNGIATAIRRMAADMPATVRYNAAGQQLQQRQRGLNIVRSQNGTVRKVMVK